MKLLSSKKGKIITSIVVVAVLAAGGGGAYWYKHHMRTSAVVSIKPISVYPAPAGLIDGTAPNLSGGVWALVNLNGQANLQLVYASSQTRQTAYPVSNAATTVASNFSNVIGVGLNTGKAGAVKFYAAQGMKYQSTVPVSGPVIALASGSGSDFYALVQVKDAASVSIVNSETHKIVGNIPMPSRTDSIAVSPDQNTIYALQGTGVVSVIDVSSSKVIQTFNVVPGDRQLAISPDGSTLYVLKGSFAANNVAVVNLATQSTVRVLPAPASCQAIVVSSSGELYDLVGTPQYGNIQVFTPQA